jgi:hypothetical protein
LEEEGDVAAGAGLKRKIVVGMTWKKIEGFVGGACRDGASCGDAVVVDDAVVVAVDKRYAAVVDGVAVAVVVAVVVVAVVVVGDIDDAVDAGVGTL